jgi:hypothetical protein
VKEAEETEENASGAEDMRHTPHTHAHAHMDTQSPQEARARNVYTRASQTREHNARGNGKRQGRAGYIRKLLEHRPSSKALCVCAAQDRKETRAQCSAHGVACRKRVGSCIHMGGCLHATHRDMRHTETCDTHRHTETCHTQKTHIDTGTGTDTGTGNGVACANPKASRSCNGDYKSARPLGSRPVD